MPTLDVDVLSPDSPPVFALVGTLDLATALRVREVLLPFARNGRDDLVLDLSGLRYLDGTGLDSLIELAAWVRGALVLRNATGLPRLLLDRTGIERLVPNLCVEHGGGPRWDLMAPVTEPATTSRADADS